MTLRALFGLAFAAWIGSQFAEAGSSGTTAAVTYVVILVVSVVLHEIAHAVVGAAVGAQVTGMRLGFGPRLTPAGSWLDLRPVIVAAHVSYVPPRDVRRSQLVAISGAGLVLHGVLIVVALALGLDHTWVRELAWANLLALVSNAVPMGASFTSTTAGPNDGAHIVALLRRQPDRRWVAAQARAEAECRAMLASATASDPAAVAHAANQAEAALSAVPANAPAADRAAVTHTVALARLLQGRYAEAAQLSAWALGAAGPAEPADRADVLATLGLAELGLHHRDAAETLLRQAMTLDRGPLVESLAQRVASTPV